MKKIVATYENVVVPGEISGSQPLNAPKTLDKTKKPSKKTGGSSKKSGKKSGKDETGGETLKTRADKLAEDPYLTPAEMSSIGGGTKEKEKKAATSDGNQKDDSEEDQEDGSKEAKKGLDMIAGRAEKTLLHAKGIFPFDFFPNTITIDANKVDIILKTFFFSETVTSIMLKEIMDVRVETALFFGKLIIDYGPHPLKVKSIYVSNLRRHDALKAKEIIEGMLVLYRGENIDTSKLKPEETIKEVRDIGMVEDEKA